MAMRISSYPHVQALTKKHVVTGKRPIRSTSPSVAALCGRKEKACQITGQAGRIGAETDFRRWFYHRPHGRCVQVNGIQSLISALSEEGLHEWILSDRFQKTGFSTKVSGVKDRSL